MAMQDSPGNFKKTIPPLQLDYQSQPVKCYYITPLIYICCNSQTCKKCLSVYIPLTLRLNCSIPWTLLSVDRECKLNCFDELLQLIKIS